MHGMRRSSASTQLNRAASADPRYSGVTLQAILNPPADAAATAPARRPYSSASATGTGNGTPSK